MELSNVLFRYRGTSVAGLPEWDEAVRLLLLMLAPAAPHMAEELWARRLAARSATHKAVIVLTDGIDTSSTLTASEVSSLAGSIDVPVYVVATVPPIDQRLMMEADDRSTQSGSADLRDLAEWTGGQVVFATTFTETAGAVSSLIGALRLQYVLAIEAASARQWRRLDVRVKAPAAVVRARSGYYGG